MFGIDSKETARIEARIDWITKCAVILIQRAAQFFRIELPLPPKEN